MFHYDRGLKLTRADLAVDFSRRQPCGFISHAHHDHMAAHEHALCTPHTGKLYQLRYGARRRVQEMPFGESIEWGGLRLTTYPAGHCLGSAMLWAHDGEKSLLYTGDFKLRRSLTAEQAELPRADVLVMESTFGDPAYRLPPREETCERLVELVQKTLRGGRPPVVEAYALGKAQEVTAILTSAGIPVLQHSRVFEVSRVYGECGVDLGHYELYPGYWYPGYAVVVPPRGHRAPPLPGLNGGATIGISGWAAHPRTRNWLKTEHALPLSDHADYDELFEAVQQVQPEVIYCTHGPRSFAELLCAEGFNAHPLVRDRSSTTLF